MPSFFSQKLFLLTLNETSASLKLLLFCCGKFFESAASERVNRRIFMIKVYKPFSAARL